MSKMPLKWHKEGLANMKKYLLEQEKQLARMVESVQRLAEDIRRTEANIALAEKRGLDGFDVERFNRKGK